MAAFQKGLSISGSPTNNGLTVASRRFHSQPRTYGAAEAAPLQNKVKIRVFQQTVKSNSKQGSYRSGKQLRHPKARATASFSASCEALG
jgi:hypothetical protein